MWQQLQAHGDLKGRIRAVSITPGRLGQILIWTDAGLFHIWYFRTVTISKLPADVERGFDPTTGILKWQNAQYPMHGICGPDDEMYTAPVITEHPGGDRLEPDPETDSLHILDAHGAIRQTIPNFRVSSEPWALATFAGDLSSLVVADPHSLRVYKYIAQKGVEQPRWKASGGDSQQKQLTRAIFDNPDEDTPRLMYADWLEENNDSTRAEFIRLQCRYEERQREAPVAYTDPDYQRMHTIERQMKERWLGELPQIHGIHWNGFRRGFPTCHVISPTTLVRSARKVWSAAPVEGVTIGGLKTIGAGSLADSPWLSRIRHLSLDRYYIGREGRQPLERLFHAPAIAGLRTLVLTSSYLNEEGMDVLANSPHLTNLEWLHTSYGAVNDASAEMLLASRSLVKLKGGPFRGSHLSAEMKERLKARFPFA